jgi:hypothetical protein
MSKRGNGADEPPGSQPSLDPDREPQSAELEPQSAELEPQSAELEPQSAELETAEHAGEEENPVTELANSGDGCWKVLADGTRVELTDSEWRKELTRLLASPPPAL